MGKRLHVAQLREVTSEDRLAVKWRAHSRTAPAQAVRRRAPAALEGATVEELAVRRHLVRNTVYWWLHRFRARGLAGLAGLEDQPRGGRPPTDPREQGGELGATAQTDPRRPSLCPSRLGRSTGSWPTCASTTASPGRAVASMRCC